MIDIATDESFYPRLVAEGISLHSGQQMMAKMVAMGFGDVGCSDWCTTALAPALQKHFCSVRQLEIDMSQNHLSDESLSCVLKTLQRAYPKDDLDIGNAVAICAQPSRSTSAADQQSSEAKVPPLVALRLGGNQISSRGLAELNDFITSRHPPLRELDISDNPIGDRSACLKFVFNLIAPNHYSWDRKVRDDVPLFINLESCELTCPERLLNDAAAQGIQICALSTAGNRCTRTRCALKDRNVPACHVQGLFEQCRKSSDHTKDKHPEDLEIRYTIVLLASGRYATAVPETTSQESSDQAKISESEAPMQGSMKHEEVARRPLASKWLPSLPREVAVIIVRFVVDRFISIRGPWGFCCGICNADYSFRKYPRVSLHVNAHRHQRRLQAFETGRLVAIGQTGLEASRFVDGLGLRSSFCSPQTVMEAKSLLPVSNTGVDLQALRAAGVRGQWASPQAIERAGRIVAARGISAEGARHRRDNKGRARWSLYAPPPGAEWSDELAQNLAEIDAFFDGRKI